MKRPDPSTFNIQSHACPYCGRLMSVDLAEDWMEQAHPLVQAYPQVNWDRKGQFYYIANKSHNPYSCSFKHS